MRILLLNQANWRFVDQVISKLENCEITEKIAYLTVDMFEKDKEGFRAAGFKTPDNEKKQYSSIHYTLKLLEKDKIYFIELQTRSLADEQFAEIENEIRYKSDSNCNAITAYTLRSLSRAASVMNFVSFQAYNCVKDISEINSYTDARLAPKRNYNKI